MFGSLRVRLPLVLPRGDHPRRSRHDADRDPAVPRLLARPGAREAEPRGERDRAPLREIRQRELRTQEPEEVERPSRAGEGDREIARARDRRPDLHPRPASALPGRQPALPGLQHFPARTLRLDLGEVADVRVHAAGDASPLLRGREPDRDRQARLVAAVRRDRRRNEEDGRQRARLRPDRAADALAGVLGLLVAALLAGYLSRRIVPSGLCSSRTRPTRSRAASTTCRSRSGRRGSSGI